MLEIFRTIFNKERGIVIGAIHLPPLPDYPDFPGFDVAIENAIRDLKAFEGGGVDAVILENNYDIPHYEFVSKSTADAMLLVAQKLQEVAKVPIGLSVLWNDYKTALTIAKKLSLPFVRIPVFVDTVETSYGIIKEGADSIIDFQNRIGAQDVLLFTDIHVKHSKILSPYSLEESARRAIQKGSGGLIITGKWTGDAPDYKDLDLVRNTVGEFPIICGSGANTKNIKEISRYTNAVIVSTALKTSEVDTKEVNLKPYQARIDSVLVKKFVAQINK
ncbi:MAG: Tryptophan synthase alpha chain [Candidatus Parcubacteria bacterium]|jgi:membrane complex biogenesis BtpA family protein